MTDTEAQRKTYEKWYRKHSLGTAPESSKLQDLLQEVDRLEDAADKLLLAIRAATDGPSRRRAERRLDVAERASGRAAAQIDTFPPEVIDAVVERIAYLDLHYPRRH